MIKLITKLKILCMLQRRGWGVFLPETMFLSFFPNPRACILGSGAVNKRGNLDPVSNMFKISSRCHSLKSPHLEDGTSHSPQCPKVPPRVKEPSVTPHLWRFRKHLYLDTCSCDAARSKS